MNQKQILKKLIADKHTIMTNYMAQAEASTSPKERERLEYDIDMIKSEMHGIGLAIKALKGQNVHGYMNSYEKDELLEDEYIYNHEVEELVSHVSQDAHKMMIDKALEEGDKERFAELTSYYYGEAQ